jgi:hypothetical protein
LHKTPIRLPIQPADPQTEHSLKRTFLRAIRMMAPTLLALSFASVARAQGTMDFSGAQTLMGTFNGRFAYVSVARASQEAQIFTNNAATLAESLRRDVSKTSAVAVGKEQVPVQTMTSERSTPIKSQLGYGIGLAL